MPNNSAIVSGNWDNPTIWSLGTVPTSADDVFTNGFIVSMNANATVLSLEVLHQEEVLILMFQILL